MSRDQPSSGKERQPENYLVSVDDAKLFVCESMEAVGTKHGHAQALAEVLVLADQRGHYSHGLNRLGTRVDTILFCWLINITLHPLSPNKTRPCFAARLL